MASFLLVQDGLEAQEDILIKIYVHFSAEVAILCIYWAIGRTGLNIQLLNYYG